MQKRTGFGKHQEKKVKKSPAQKKRGAESKLFWN